MKILLCRKTNKLRINMFENFKSCITPLICEKSCGSVTYGYVTGVYDWEKGRIVERIICGGCDAVQSESYSAYLDSQEYADDFIKSCFDDHSELYGIHDYLGRFVHYYKTRYQRDSLLMRMITT